MNDRVYFCPKNESLHTDHQRPAHCGAAPAPPAPARPGPRPPPGRGASRSALAPARPRLYRPLTRGPRPRAPRAAACPAGSVWFHKRLNKLLSQKMCMHLSTSVQASRASSYFLPLGSSLTQRPMQAKMHAPGSQRCSGLRLTLPPASSTSASALLL